MLKNSLLFLGVFFIAIAVVKFLIAMHLRHQDQIGGDTDA